MLDSMYYLIAESDQRMEGGKLTSYVIKNIFIHADFREALNNINAADFSDWDVRVERRQDQVADYKDNFDSRWFLPNCIRYTQTRITEIDRSRV